MEFFVYECPECSFIHRVPSYWMSYTADPHYEIPHMSPNTKEMCHSTELTYKDNV